MATKTKPVRTMGVIYSHEFADGSAACGVRVTCGKVRDLYTVSRERDSLEIEWSHGTQPDRSYTVTVTVGGSPVACTCDGFRFGGECRHAAATRSLLASGHLDNGPDQGDDYPDGYGWSDERDDERADYWRAACGDSVRVGCR